MESTEIQVQSRAVRAAKMKEYLRIIRVESANEEAA